MASGSGTNPPLVVANVIERSRVYREPVKSPPIPYNKIKLAKRPGHGTRGIPLDLKVNWFRIKFDNKPKDTCIPMYIYKVVVESEKRVRIGKNVEKGWNPVTIPSIVSACVYKVVHSYRDVFKDKWRVIFDDFEYLFTPDRLLVNRPEVTLFTEDNKFSYSLKMKTKIRVRIMPFVKFDLRWGNANDVDAQWSAIFIKLLLSQNARFVPPELNQGHEFSIHERFAHFGGAMYYIPRTVNETTNQKSELRKKMVQPGCEAWTGFYLANRFMEDGDPVINFGMTNKFFDSLNLNLVDFYGAIINKLGRAPQKITLMRDSVMSEEGIADFTERLSGLKVKCTMVPEKDRGGLVKNGIVERHYEFIRAMKTTECADNYYLATLNPIRKQIEEVRMDVWYERQRKPLKFPKLPLCELKSGKKTDFLPMEVLFTCGKPTPYTKRLDITAREVATLLTRSPQDHNKLTTIMATRDLEYDKDPFVKAMQIILEKEMVECPSRVLNKNGIIAIDDSGEKIDMDPENGDFNMNRAYQTTEKEIIFVACNLTNRITDEVGKSFCRRLVEKCEQRGMKVSATRKFLSLDKNEVSPFIEAELFYLENRKRIDNEILVFIFLGTIDEFLYGEIKLLSDLNHGVVTQVITEQTVTKMHSTLPDVELYDYKSVFHNIWLKLNVKLGGVNQIVEFSDPTEPEPDRLPSHEKTMFIGIDAIHPSPNSPIRSFSLAAIVASLDKNATKYTDRIMVNVNCNETIQHFEHHFAALLLDYHGHRGHYPERIVILRDGVSDSEMILAASRELQSIKEAWIRCADAPLPPFTYIVVQKRHRTRFYRSDVMDKDKNLNPFPGTVVTEKAVSPHKFDFYMISHYTPAGTSRPAHYTVVVDESSFSTDAITEMCFRLCCLHARCSQPVSIPAPVYYAHLRCKRAAVQFRFAVRAEHQSEIEDIRSGQDSQTYMEQSVLHALKIENFLNRDFAKPKKHPGMAWL